MKILEIVYGLASGGEERFVVDLSNELSKTEDVYLLVLKDVDRFYASQLSPRIKVYYANFPVGFSISQIWSVYKIVKTLSPDVVHMHDASRYYTFFPSVLLGRKIKFYMTIHSDVLKAYNKGISGLQVRAAHYLGHTRFITISPHNHSQFKSLYPKYQVAQITNGRAFPSYSEEYEKVKDEIDNYKIDKQSTVFIHVASCLEVKNQSLLINAFNKHVEKYPNSILLIIGQLFSSPLGEYLKSIACNNIYFLGTRQNVYDYLSFSDAFCLSSKMEGMPMSIIEAVLSGVPIISTTVSGAIDAVEDGENGYLSADFEVDSYEELLSKFEENKPLLKYNAQRNIDNSSFSITVCAQKYLDWFKD